jgi:hypothetical protein
VAGACGGGAKDPSPPKPPVVREIEGSEAPRTGRPTPQEVAVIRGWADALRAGRVRQAAAFFSLPALIADGSAPLRRVAGVAGIREFNRRLPCGAVLVSTRRGAPSFVLATFRLTERPGAGECGDGTGHLAAVSFLVERRHIVQWLRAPDPASPPPDAQIS